MPADTAIFARPSRTAVIALVCASVLPVLTANAQWASLRGRVTDGRDGEPLPGVHITLTDSDGKTVGTITNSDGYYLLPRLYPGLHAARYSFVGYAAHEQEVEFQFDGVRKLDVALEVDEASLRELVVESERPRHEHAGTAGFVSIRPTEVEKIPLPGLSPDLATFLTAQPGVNTTGEQGGQLYIRGGTPVQNLFLVDGIPIYQPLHIVGFYSAFPADIISVSNIYAGGFGARYGGRLSSVVDVSTRNGSKRRVVGSASIAPFLGSVHVEVPILRDRVSVVASVRESIIERIAPDVLQEELPYRFGDQFAKLHAFLGSTSHIAVTALQTSDRGNISGTTGLVNGIWWRNRAVGARYFYLAQEFPVLTELVLAVSRFDMRTGPEGDPDQTSEVSGFTGAINFGYLFGSWEAHFGLFAYSTAYRYNLDARSSSEVEEFIGEGGAYLDLRFLLPKNVTLEPGFRIHSFASRGQMFAEPRIRASWKPTWLPGNSTLSMAAGIYHQQTVGITSDRIVTDVFTAWSPSPKFEPVPRATHLIAGWSGNFGNRISASLEAYRKSFDHLAFPDASETLRPDTRFLDANGTSFGVDARAALQRPSWFGMISYGLASVSYEAEGRRFRPPHDRRHHVNAALGLSIPAGLLLTARWQFGSGLPFTQLEGFFDALPFSPTSNEHLSAPGTTSIAFAEAYEARLPPYHRLDVAVEKRFESRTASATIQVGAVNIYDRSNLFDLDLFTAKRVNQLPIIPVIGLRIEAR